MSKYDEVASGVTDGIAAPFRGLNTQSSLAGLTQDYALTLDNWVCQPDAIVTRGGATTYASGFTSAPKTLLKYSSATASKMFAATDNGLFNVSLLGAIGASVATCTSGFGKSVNFATSAGQYLYFANGVNSPLLYDGTTWTSITGASTPAITGPVTTNFFDVETYRQRLYFLHKDFLGFYYLPADSIAGAATAFRIGSVCRLGGKVVAHGTWSIDGGFGPDDHYALATSNGEVVVYHGSDPGVVANWTYIGTYALGIPLGQNCFAKFGGDLLYLSENGVIPLSSILQSTGLNFSKAMTLRIQPTISTQAALYGSLLSWKIHVIPKRSLVVINVPQNSVTSIQFVYNSLSKAWSTFSGWNASDFIEFEGQTYFTTGFIVAKAFDGSSDFGNNIVAICDTAYNRFGTRKQLLPLMMRALFASNALVPYTLGIAQDFSDVYTENTFGVSGPSGGLWNSGTWNTAVWGGSFDLHKDWVTIAVRGGLALSTRFQVSSKYASTILLALDYKFANQGLVS